MALKIDDALRFKNDLEKLSTFLSPETLTGDRKSMAPVLAIPASLSPDSVHLMPPLCSENLALLEETPQLVNYLPQRHEELRLSFTFKARHGSEFYNPSSG